MKKFNIFLLITFVTLFSTTQLNAFTSPNQYANNIDFVENVIPIASSELTSNYTMDKVNAKFEELQVASSASSSFIQDNLTLLYSICFALILINLVAQIKIIVQMVKLFFQFRKKDDKVRLNF